MWTFETLNEAEYDAFASKHVQAHFRSSIYAGRRWKDRGGEPEYVGVKEDGKIIAGALIVNVRSIALGNEYYAPSGYLMDYDNAELVSFMSEKIKAYLKKKKALFIKIDPYVPYQEHDTKGNIVAGGFNHQKAVDHLLACGYDHHGFTKGYDLSRQCRWMSVLNVQGKNEEEMLMHCSATTRYNIRKAGRDGIKVREIGLDELDTFLAMENDSAQRQGFQDEMNGKAFYEDMKEKYGDRFKIVLAEKHGEDGSITPLSGGSFVFYGNEVVYLSSGTFKSAMKSRSIYLVQWEMICQAIRHGYSYYNFYGISGFFNEGEEGYGVYFFKSGYRADVVELLGEFILPIDNVKYKIYKELKGIKDKAKS